MSDPELKNAISLVWPISKLKPWDKNPRTIKEHDFKRLQKQIEKLGIYKPLLVTEDGIVLGGNMRLKALTELGKTEVWVSVVEAPDDATKLEYALSDNDRAGDYLELELAELVETNLVELDLYKVDLKPTTALKDLPSLVDPATAPKQDICKHCPEHCPTEEEV